MESDNYVEVMGLLNAIVRCFNDNIGKVDLATARPAIIGRRRDGGGVREQREC